MCYLAYPYTTTAHYEGFIQIDHKMRNYSSVDLVIEFVALPTYRANTERVRAVNSTT
jgi:hypothetical protein